MSKLLYIAFLGGLLWSSQSKAQVVLEALDAPEFKLPSGITLSSGERFLVSIYDNDYLPFNLPTTPATWDRPINAGGGNDILIDYQGTITTTGIEVTIPISVTGTVQLPEYNQTINIPAEKTEDGISRDIVLEWAPQNLTNINKSISAWVRSIGSDLKIKKLDVNGGLGDDYKGVELATFTYPKSASNTSISTYTLRVISGIPDKKFGIATNGELEHQFLYMPIVLQYAGRTWVWLQHNLGAEYTRLPTANNPNPHFSPTFVPERISGHTDYLSYGSLFQWGRDSDGHELINWTHHPNGYPAGISDYRYIDGRRKHNALFLNSANNTVYNRLDDPCPNGFRMPNYFEIVAISDSMNIPKDSNTELDRLLAIPYSGIGVDNWSDGYHLGRRHVSRYTNWAGIWSSDLYEYNNYQAYVLQTVKPYENPSLGLEYTPGPTAWGVRCIKDYQYD